MTSVNIDYQSATDEIKTALGEATAIESALLQVVTILDHHFAHFHWTGIYLLEGDTLVVGPYVGAETPHTRIKVGEGICGSAAKERATIVVDDVNADSRYLACSLSTRSEIVVPLLDGDRVLGEIDIDSNIPAAFSSDDREFLETIAQLVVSALVRLSK